MTIQSQTMTFSFTLPRKLVENGARAIGFLVVALPIVAFAKSLSGPEPTHIPLPLPYVEKQSTYKPVNDRELDCLAANIYYESRNQPAIGQLAVGITTYVRARDANWPNSICSVVNQHKQFSWVNNLDKQYDHIASKDIAYLEALNLSSKILAGDYDNLLTVFNPTHFHTVRVNPKWNRNMAKLARINDHIFYE